jgi:PAS domain S-box-containing protein
VSPYSDTRLAALADAMPQLVWTARPDGTVDYYSARHREFKGIEQRPDGTWRWNMVVHPDDLEATVRRWRHSLATGEPYEVEHRVQRADGTLSWLLSRAVATRDESGKVLKWYGTSTDIDAQKRATEALIESESRYRIIVETQPDGLIIAGRTGHLLDVNDAYARHSGYSRAELLAKSIPDLHPPGTQRGVFEKMAWVAEKGSVLFETIHCRKDGTRWLVEVDASFAPVAGGRYVIFLRDINRRNRSERLLRARLQLSEIALRGDLEELLRTALDSAELFSGSSIGFFHFVDDDQETLTMQTWSTNTLAAMCTASGKGNHYAVSKAGVWVDCVAEKGPVIHNDYAHLPHRKGMPEGHAPVVRQLTVPVLQGGKVVAVLGVGNKATDYAAEDIEPVRELGYITMDLVARLRAERQYAALLAVSQEEAKVKSRLLRETNHRVKNNLLSLRGMLRVERRLMPQAERPGVAAYLGRIDSHVQGLLAAHELLSSSQWGSLDAETLARALVQTALEAAGAQARFSVETHGAGVRFSPRQVSALALVISELATNSAKHASPGGAKLVIQTRARPDGEWVVFEYRDSGDGYPPAALEAKGGLGLGLLHEIVEGTLRGTMRLFNEGGAVTEIRIRAEAPETT